MKKVACILMIILLAAIFLSMNLGTLAISPLEFISTLMGNGTAQSNIAVFTLRLPRLVIAMLVGGALALSGTILQSVTHNDLAEPGILGISAGATLFVVVYIYMTNGNNYYSMPLLSIFTMPFIAMCGGVFAAMLVYLLAWKKGVSPTRILLMGISVNAAFSALVIVMQLKFNIKDFNRILMWTSGSIWGSSWNYVIAVCPIILIVAGITLYKSRYLDAFNLGDETCLGLGIHVEKQRLSLIILSVALAGAATSVAGSISFVGLIAPHIARRLVGPKHKSLLIIAMLVGMILVVVADMIARNLFAPIELYLGIVVSIIGVPYFIYLILKQ